MCDFDKPGADGSTEAVRPFLCLPLQGNGGVRAGFGACAL